MRASARNGGRRRGAPREACGTDRLRAARRRAQVRGREGPGGEWHSFAGRLSAKRPAAERALERRQSTRGTALTEFARHAAGVNRVSSGRLNVCECSEVAVRAPEPHRLRALRVRRRSDVVPGGREPRTPCRPNQRRSGSSPGSSPPTPLRTLEKHRRRRSAARRSCRFATRRDAGIFGSEAIPAERVASVRSARPPAEKNPRDAQPGGGETRDAGDNYTLAECGRCRCAAIETSLRSAFCGNSLRTRSLNAARVRRGGRSAPRPFGHRIKLPRCSDLPSGDAVVNSLPIRIPSARRARKLSRWCVVTKPSKEPRERRRSRLPAALLQRVQIPSR